MIYHKFLPWMRNEKYMTSKISSHYFKSNVTYVRIRLVDEMIRLKIRKFVYLIKYAYI